MGRVCTQKAFLDTLDALIDTLKASLDTLYAFFLHTLKAFMDTPKLFLDTPKEQEAEQDLACSCRLELAAFGECLEPSC